MQYCMQVEAVFSSEIIWTDFLNARRWKQRSKNYENACNHLCPSKQRLPPNLDARVRGKYAMLHIFHGHARLDLAAIFASMGINDCTHLFKYLKCRYLTVIGQFTADSRVGSRNQCTPAD